MMSPYSISVVLPAFNEEDNLRATVADAVAVLDDCAGEYEIIIVDDGSTDKTAAVARLLSDSNSRVRLVSHDCNRGYGSTVRTGFASARYALVFLTDADGQFWFDNLPEFLSHIDGFDAVIGYRQERADPWYRHWLSRAGNFIARFSFGIRARDIDCAYKLIRRSVLERVSLSSEGTMISTELLAGAGNAGWRLKELPVPHRPRKHGLATGAQFAVIWRTMVEFAALP
jgi:glycosyltransferase involved in cell wall biosynthesis